MKNDLQKASEELSKKNSASAKPKQKSAAKKMKSMAEQMDAGMEGGEQEQMEEDLGEDFDACTVNFSHNGDYSDREGDGSSRNDYGMHRGNGAWSHKDSGLTEDSQGNGRG